MMRQGDLSKLARVMVDIPNGLDDLLARNGYKRSENGFYEVTNGNNDYVVLFCHMGMTRVMLSHLLNLPYQVLASSLQYNFTGVTTLYFPEEPEESGYVTPFVYSIGDYGHLNAGMGPCKHFISGKEI